MRTRPESTVLLIIDLQERLLPVIRGIDSILDRTCRLAEAASLLGVRRILTEQYPKGLGRTAESVAAACPPPLEKLSFSAAGTLDRSAGSWDGIESVVIAGVETHVCVLQTALDLLAEGFAVFVAVDAVGSRSAIDHDTALGRLSASGAILTTSESVLFEWCRSAEHPQFRPIRELVIRPARSREP